VSTRAILLLSLLAVVGCDQLKKKKAEGEAPSASASAAPSASAPTAATAAAMAGVRTIAGVGDVPAWAPDRKLAACKIAPAVRAKLAPLEKGEDTAFAGGTGDVGKLVKDIGADTCATARQALAQALNDGGFRRYNAKKVDEANHYWTASLTVRPAVAITRYNLACGLALAGKSGDAIAEIAEIARAAQEGDASAANFLEKAKSDGDLASVRNDPAFKKALEASNAGLVGPRKEPETAAKAIPLLPDDFRKVKDEITGNGGFVTYKPAVTNFWTWRPNATTELLVATIIDDPAKAGKPKGDMNQDYGGIAVFKREGDKLRLLIARKTGESPPSVAAGKSNTVLYSFDEPCGTLKGHLTWSGTAVEVHEKTCADL
jgi:hypothetical protein